MLRSSLPPSKEVTFQDSVSGKKWRVKGRFALQSPWWQVTCKARCQRSMLVVQGFPSYQLRSGLNREGWRSMVSLFLRASACNVALSGCFFEWLPKTREVTFSNLMKILAEFERAGNVDAAQHLKDRITHSVPGMQVQAALLYPHVMKYLPTLLPGHFVELLKNDVSLLNQLEQILKTDVWKLGFYNVMYKEVKLIHCEAQLQAFIDCKLLHRIPLSQHNALWAYDKLKKYCYGTGSTYMDLQLLCDKLGQEKGMYRQVTLEAIDLLKELGVVLRDKQKVFLHTLHSYETGIAGSLRRLMKREQWKIPLNAREVLHAAAVERRRSKSQAVSTGQTKSHENGNLGGNPVPVRLPHDKTRTSGKSGTDGEDPESLPPIELDEDQVRAAEMICANPVTVISGKGGCGKTTVVSELFKALIHHEEEEIKEACADFENDTGGSQGWEEPQLSSAFHFQSEGEVQKEEEEGKKHIQILLTAPTGKAASLLTKKTPLTAYTLHQVVLSFIKTEKHENGRPKNWRFKWVRVLVVDEGSLVCVQLLNSVLSLLTSHARLNKFIILGDVRQLPSIEPGNTLCDLFQSLEVPRSWAIEMKTNHRAESELIVRNAGLIADIGMKKTYCQLEFDAIVDLKGQQMPSADKRFIHIRLPANNQASADDLQSAIKLLIDSAPGLKDDNTSQFIAFKRSDVELINELCCKKYNNHTTKDHNNSLLFQPGDKVCCTKSRYNEDKLRLYNGEMFFIKEMKDEGRVTLDDGDGQVITENFSELQRECRLQHAWARTIHTFQGSETETIVYVLGSSRAQTWKHVYTAVTRGQKRVYVVAKEEDLMSTIRRRETPRKTQLSGLVKEVLLKFDRADTPSPPRLPSLTTVPPTSLSSQTPVPSPPLSHSSPRVPKSLWKAGEVKDEVLDKSVMDDMVFWQAYSWSPMSSPEKQSVSLEASGVLHKEQLGCVTHTVSPDCPSNKRLHSDDNKASKEASPKKKAPLPPKEEEEEWVEEDSSAEEVETPPLKKATQAKPPAPAPVKVVRNEEEESQEEAPSSVTPNTPSFKDADDIRLPLGKNRGKRVGVGVGLLEPEETDGYMAEERLHVNEEKEAHRKKKKRKRKKKSRQPEVTEEQGSERQKTTTKRREPGLVEKQGEDGLKVIEGQRTEMQNKNKKSREPGLTEEQGTEERHVKEDEGSGRQEKRKKMRKNREPGVTKEQGTEERHPVTEAEGSERQNRKRKKRREPEVTEEQGSERQKRNTKRREPGLVEKQGEDRLKVIEGQRTEMQNKKSREPGLTEEQGTEERHVKEDEGSGRQEKRKKMRKNREPGVTKEQGTEERHPVTEAEGSERQNRKRKKRREPEVTEEQGSERQKKNTNRKRREQALTEKRGERLQVIEGQRTEMQNTNKKSRQPGLTEEQGTEERHVTEEEGSGRQNKKRKKRREPEEQGTEGRLQDIERGGSKQNKKKRRRKSLRRNRLENKCTRVNMYIDVMERGATK